MGGGGGCFSTADESKKCFRKKPKAIDLKIKI